MINDQERSFERDAEVESLEELERYLGRRDLLAFVTHATSVALRATLIGAFAATVVTAVALGVPVVAIPDQTTIALAWLTHAFLIAVFASAVLASRSR